MKFMTEKIMNDILTLLQHSEMMDTFTGIELVDHKKTKHANIARLEVLDNCNGSNFVAYFDFADYNVYINANEYAPPLEEVGGTRKYLSELMRGVLSLKYDNYDKDFKRWFVELNYGNSYCDETLDQLLSGEHHEEWDTEFRAFFEANKDKKSNEDIIMQGVDLALAKYRNIACQHLSWFKYEADGDAHYAEKSFNLKAIPATRVRCDIANEYAELIPAGFEPMGVPATIYTLKDDSQNPDGQ